MPDLLTRVVPDIDRGQRGLGSLLQVLLDESLRLGLPVTDPRLRDHLAGFTGGLKDGFTAVVARPRTGNRAKVARGDAVQHSLTFRADR